jgi:hypothetical protein
LLIITYHLKVMCVLASVQDFAAHNVIYSWDLIITAIAVCVHMHIAFTFATYFYFSCNLISSEVA